MLDVGAGAGKFAIVGELTTRSRFIGIEMEAEIVKTANAIARHYKIEGARFRHGDATVPAAWEGAHGVYLYNPFTAENSMSGIESTLLRLSEAPAGLRVVTFCGIGAEMPTAYRLVEAERTQAGPLCFWEKL